MRRSTAAWAIFDIDDFRSINREYGHEVGDRVLTTVARLLRSLMRKDDIISRIGGERFAVLLSRAGADQAEALCQRVVMTLSDISGPDGWAARGRRSARGGRADHAGRWTKR